MGWFLSYQVQSWNGRWSGRGATEWTQPELYVDMARSLERAGFDYLMFEDGSFVSDAYGSSMDYALRTARLAPKHDPIPLVAAVAAQTRNIGLIATVTTTFYPPFLAARLFSTLDHLSAGRIGANLVTSHNVRTAQNYGLREQIEHDERYAMADEWVEVCNRLWASWEPDAVRADPDAGIYADHTKVHPIDFEGKYFRSRGPLTTIPGPQGRPVLCQAGGSAAGKEFGAKHADTIIAQVTTVEEMKAYREDVSALAVAAGRRPEDVKVLFICSFALTDSAEQAAELRRAQSAAVAANVEANLAMMSFASGQDFSRFDLDAPVPRVQTNAAKSTLAWLTEGHPEGTTLREIASRPLPVLSFTGTPDAVAAEMGELVAESGADGYLVSGRVDRRFIAEIADGLAPELRRRGLIRDGYAFPTLRENLLAF
ncbi:NtaA/DmoA family FMN-dependent monooxygenase [Pseudonocardia sp. WMMC193]|uniref:NtaA/DmoA family FMN-dependent monooxygenase n=1 Tax=Pseudonocardia sp. WMMC193 TaxID=2911965 RepID=UPI001EEF5A35|nr:NtaA/DmoA family FMN-dependent monooxygenase [Pseudonocardia sp. WMMC193]MCF7549999.1 NtaA/DmoA family FMN-dependent monooxygenase [Pseudonocardia sp. WMMC193]